MNRITAFPEYLASIFFVVIYLLSVQPLADLATIFCVVFCLPFQQYFFLSDSQGYCPFPRCVVVLVAGSEGAGGGGRFESAIFIHLPPGPRFFLHTVNTERWRRLHWQQCQGTGVPTLRVPGKKGGPSRQGEGRRQRDGRGGEGDSMRSKC